MAGAGRRPTRQEVNRRREGAQFVGRRGELAVFRETFARDPEEPDFPFLFHVRGNGGVGKSTLVRQWEGAARERASVVTAYVDDDVHDVFEAMEAVSARLGRQGHPLKRFDKQLSAYRQRRHQAESVAPAPQPDLGGGQAASPAGTVAAQVGLVGLGMVPGVGAFVGAVDPQQVALGADRLRTALNTRLRSHDDVQLVMNPVAVLAPVFLDDLAEVAERCERVVLFFDVYERTGPVLDGWLHDIVFGEEYGGLPVNVQIVLSGQLRLDTRVWGDRLGQVTDVCLEVFTEEEARTLLATHGVTDEPSVELVLRLSGRLPLLVDMLARSGASAEDSFGDPSETAVERFLKWEPDTRRREAALACALPLQIDEDVFRAAAPEAADGYPWLRGLAFVSTQAGRCRYHDVVRAAMLRLQRGRSPARWQQAHTRLADVFEQWRLAAEADIGTDSSECWGDSVWREHRLNETYHRLCANHRAALPDALHQAVEAMDHDLATLRRWAQIIGQAGHDTEAAGLSSWGRRLEAAGEQDEASTAVLGLLLTAPELGAPGRALAYSVRAREYRIAGDHARALADYALALEIDPAAQRPHAGRGETYRLMGRHEDAVIACTRAVELDPLDARAVGSRGDAYRSLGRYDEALADFDRAVDLDPGYAWAFGSRAQVHEALGRPDEAVADYTRAIEIRPEYTWALGSRAFVHQSSGRHAEALVDYTRAVEINPQYAWAFASRGRFHHFMGQYEAALADYTRAVEVDPDYGWAFGSRADTYVKLGRDEDALADYTRAVEVDPDYGWALARRADTYARLGRHGDALADYTRAIEVDPDHGWALARRANTYFELGRYEEALADSTGAIAVDPRSAFPILSRALVFRRLGRYAEAADDYSLALEVDPRPGELVPHRAEMYRRAGRYEDAVADYGQVMAAEAPAAWSFAGRAQLHLRLGRYEEALADCVRAVETDSEDGWYVGLYALSSRLTGNEREAETHFRRAIGLLLPDGSGDSTKKALELGCVLFMHCALQEWERATARCDVLLGGAPEPHVIREVLEDLSLLREVLPSVVPGTDPLVRRLSEALGRA
ncbi:tetratricopeptide repeat protein [Streptomyces sp. NPDC048565]|uniref:tetratricopeptide repeat protein n=1 Tax=Streptomyces sp. NPDC048565 TaxID=3155266 RepID=UPI003441FB64